MRTHTLDSDHASAIWQRVIQFQGELAPSAAQALLGFGFSEQDHALMNRLSTKARAGTLTPIEQTELDTFERPRLPVRHYPLQGSAGPEERLKTFQ
jgi:hypothetical protein